MKKHRISTLALLFILIITACSSPADTPALDPPVATTPTVTATPQPTPTPTATLPPPPEVLVTEGDVALFAGDFTTAMEIFQDALTRSVTPRSPPRLSWGSVRPISTRAKSVPP
jgi:hypothetical protein